MADEVVKAPEVVTPVEAQEAAIAKKPARGRKKGTVAKPATAKKAETKTVEKKPGRKPGSKTTVKKTTEKKTVTSKKTTVPELTYKSMTIEFNDKKYSEKDLFNRVKAYVSSHPYIVAHEIELFLKPQDGCCYFTIDGFSNPDFKIDL